MVAGESVRTCHGVEPTRWSSPVFHHSAVLLRISALAMCTQRVILRDADARGRAHASTALRAQEHTMQLHAQIRAHIDWARDAVSLQGGGGVG